MCFHRLAFDMKTILNFKVSLAGLLMFHASLIHVDKFIFARIFVRFDRERFRRRKFTREAEAANLAQTALQ